MLIGLPLLELCPYSWISRQTVPVHRFPTPLPTLTFLVHSIALRAPLLEYGQQCRNSLQSKLSFNLKHAVLLLGCFQVLKRNDLKTITLLSLGNYGVCFFVHVSESDSPLRDPTSHPTGHGTAPKGTPEKPFFYGQFRSGTGGNSEPGCPQPRTPGNRAGQNVDIWRKRSRAFQTGSCFGV